MADGRPTGPDETVGDLVGRLLEDGRDYAKAELALVKAVARHRVARAKTGAILAGVGITLLLSSLTALVLGSVLGLATLMHPALAGLIVFLILAVIGGLLARAGVSGLAALGGDEDEQAALAQGERAP